MKSKGHTLDEFHLPQRGILLQGERNMLVDQEQVKYDNAQHTILHDTNVAKLNAQ